MNANMTQIGGLAEKEVDPLTTAQIATLTTTQTSNSLTLEQLQEKQRKENLARDMNTTQVGGQSTTEIGALGKAQLAEGKAPMSIDEALKQELIKAAMMIFPGLGLMFQAINIAKRENRNIVLPLIFAADGRVLIQEPIVMKAEPPKPEDKKAEEVKPNG